MRIDLRGGTWPIHQSLSGQAAGYTPSLRREFCYEQCNQTVSFAIRARSESTALSDGSIYCALEMSPLSYLLIYNDLLLRC